MSFEVATHFVNCLLSLSLLKGMSCCTLYSTHIYIYTHILSEVLYLLEGIAPSQILLAYHAALAQTYYALFLKGLLLVIEFPFQAQCCFSPEFTSLKTFFDQKNLHFLRGITL